MPTKIEWTQETWNPIVGCSKVSRGCDNCYAIRQAHRLASNPNVPIYEGLTKIQNGRPNWTGMVRLAEDRLDQPLRWKKPRRIFVNSMSDLFHEDVPDTWIDDIFAVMAMACWHQFQILTKRPQRMVEYFSNIEERAESIGWAEHMIHGHSNLKLPVQSYHGPRHRKLPLPNVWLGVSVEDKKTTERIPLLLETPASVRWISFEPLLERIWFPKEFYWYYSQNTLIDWVVVGAESGPGARPMDEDWVRLLLYQCLLAGTPFFYKQKVVNGRKVGLPKLDGKVWAQYPTEAH